MVDDWARVELDGAEITGLLIGDCDQAVAYGRRGDRPLAVLLDSTGVKREVTPLGSGAVTSACAYSGAYDFVVGRSYPLLTTHDFDRPHPPGCQCNGRIEDATTEGAVRLWTVCSGGEDVMVLTIRADGWLLQGHMVDGAADPGRGLRVVGDVEDVDLVVGAREQGQMLVAGPLVGGDGTTHPVWWRSLDGWVPYELQGPVDAVTDMDGGLVAGHLGLRPVLGGRLRPSPDVDLDPDWPHVALVDGVDVVALQSTDGPQLWSFIDGGWRSEGLPPGRLSGGLRAQPWQDDDPSDPIHADDRLFVVIDGHIWHRATG